jgi:HD-GYP domain-containing protein (c-di-GMP phosphodiesterase class II)
MQLCDTGRIGVKEEILHKPGPLTEKEYEHVMEHPALGERLLSPILNDSEVLAVIKHHHERWDGTGKPQGLKGPAIPLLARVAAVADAFVAMTSPRPYRSPLSLKEAKSEIMKGSGTFFDPHVVSAFQRLSDSELANIVNCAA